MSNAVERLMAKAGLNSEAPAASRPGDGWITLLDRWSLCRIEGPDTRTYLQGQLTADIRQLSDSRSLLAANCTPKGQVIGLFRLMPLAEDDVLLRMNATTVANASANLKKYMVFSKATLTDLGDSWCGLGLAGPQAEALLREQWGRVPETADEQQRAGDGVLVRVPGDQPRFELWLPEEQAAEQWTALAGKLSVHSPATWLADEIRAVLPQLDERSQGEYLPQMLNLQALNGVSFSKGCYIGQEVVARLQHRGKLKKLLHAVEAEAPMQPGSDLHSPDRLNAGKVLTAVALDNGQHLALAVIGKSAADGGDLRLDRRDGPEVRLLPLPYTIDPELFER